MTDLAPKVLLFIAFLYVYIGGIRGRPNILEDTARGENQKTFEESDLLKRSKAKSGGQGKGNSYMIVYRPVQCENIYIYISSRDLIQKKFVCLRYITMTKRSICRSRLLHLG